MQTDTDNRNARASAVGIVAEWLAAGRFPERLMGPVTDDRAFIMELVYGVARWKRALEWVVSRCADREPDGVLLPYLLVGLYQLLRMDNVAQYAAVNETVEVAKSGPHSYAAGFVNAVAEGQFHIYPVSTVEEGIQILTGVPAGAPQEDGTFPDGTVFARVQARLDQIRAALKEEAEKKDDDKKS